MFKTSGGNLVDIVTLLSPPPPPPLVSLCVTSLVLSSYLFYLVPLSPTPFLFTPPLFSPSPSLPQDEMSTMLQTQEELQQGSLKINSMLQEMDDKTVSNC